MKKIIGFFVCTLLIFSIIPLTTTANTPIRKTITVNDDGWADYDNIQDAVDHANNGDTIFVYSGTYYENVIIDVSIDLIGEDKETTIVDGSGEDDVFLGNVVGQMDFAFLQVALRAALQDANFYFRMYGFGAGNLDSKLSVDRSLVVSFQDLQNSSQSFRKWCSLK